MFYVESYDGSEVVQSAIDARSCAILWTSPQYVGAVQLVNGDNFYCEIDRKEWGDREDKSLTVKIGADCLPVK